MALTPENLTALRDVFPVNDHEFRNGFAYIKEGPIATRIEDVDPSFSFEIVDILHRDGTVAIKARLTICGVSRENIGMEQVRSNNSGNEVNEAEKSAATDALKRCARLFGIGRYLLELPDNVKDARSLAAYFGTSVQQPAAHPPKQAAPKANGYNPPTGPNPWLSNADTAKTFLNKCHEKFGLEQQDVITALGIMPNEVVKALPDFVRSPLEATGFVIAYAAGYQEQTIQEMIAKYVEEESNRPIVQAAALSVVQYA